MQTPTMVQYILQDTRRPPQPEETLAVLVSLGESNLGMTGTCENNNLGRMREVGRCKQAQISKGTAVVSH